MQAHKQKAGRAAYQKGLWAETLCRLVLRLKFYRILKTRYKTPMGEIDLVAARGRSLVFIEVKARTTRDQAIESVLPHQQQRLSRAANHFLMAHPAFLNHHARFDIMAVSPHKWPHHIQNAFAPD